jgi:hypothetical protein
MSALRAGIASFLESPSGAVKAGDLPVHVMRLLDTDISAVQLSDMTMEKQRLNHGDLTDQDYAVLPELLADPTVVLQQDTNHVLLLRRSGRIWLGVVKATLDRRQNFLQSFRITNAKDIQTLLVRHALKFGNADDLGG